MGRRFELMEESGNIADSAILHSPQQLGSFSPSSHCAIYEEEGSLIITSKNEEEAGAAVLNGWGRPIGEEEGESKLAEGKEELKGENKKLEAANKGVLPWIALLFLCMCPLGGYLAYDVPGALNISLKEERGLSLTQIGALYTAYAIPTVLTSPFCGIANQIFGTHRLLVVCNALLTLGAFGFAFAENYTLMIFARILFGSGAEILFVAGSLQIEKWFRHSKYMGFAFGACSCFPLIGTICAFAALPSVSLRWNLRGALLVAAAFVGFSTAMASIYASFIHPHLKFATEAESKVEKVNLSNILKSVRGIQKEFWLLGLYVFSIYTTGFSFLAIAGRFFNEKYGFSDIYSSWLICVFSAVAFLFGPLLTIVLDKILRRVTIGIVAGIFNTGIYIVFGFTTLHPVYTLVVAAFSFVAGSTTTLCLTSKFASGKDIGILFSLISVFQNLTFLTMPVIFGAIRDFTGGYEWSCSFFAFVSFLGTLCLVVLRMLKIGESLDVGPEAKAHPNGVELEKVECTKDQP